MSTTLSPLRADLELSQQARRDGVLEVVVRDPLNRNIYAFPAKAFAILSKIQAGQTIADLIGPSTDEASARRHQQVEMLIQKARDFGLFVGAPMPVQRTVAAPKTLRRRILAKLTNPIWHLFDIPLQKVEPGARMISAFLFGRGAWLALPVILMAFACLIANYQAYLGSIQIFAGFIWWWIVLPLVFLATVWHETGHYCAALKAGHKVTRGGVAIVIAFPALFIRVDDYFMVAKRRDRLVIALGGVYFDALVFSGCLFTWLLVQPFSMLGQITYVVSFVVLFRIVLNLVPFFKMDGCRAFEEILGIRHVRMEALGVLRSIRNLKSYQLKGLSRVGLVLLAVYGILDMLFMLFAVWMAQQYIRTNASAWNRDYADVIAGGFGLFLLLSFLLGVRQDIRRKSMQKMAG